MIAEVYIELKKGVADPEGENTLKALKLLGFSTVRNVETVKMFRIHMDEEDEERARNILEDMCERLLANPVIQSYRIVMK